MSYVVDLVAAADKTNFADDRPAYTAHLAAAARMFAAVRGGRSLQALKELVASERRAFGWSFLSGDPGRSAESAFDRFASFVEALEEERDGH